ncbi:MAG: hypothetical protein DRG83_19500, partial [Deltaproteobacteria bacterium]
MPVSKCEKRGRLEDMRLNTPLKLPKTVARWVLSWITSPQAVHLIGEPIFWLGGQRRSRKEFVLCRVKRVLVVRLDEIGDVVMTAPFLRELRRNLPHAWITLVVQPQVFNLVELCPYTNEVLTYDWKTKGHFPELRLHARALWLAFRHLWPCKFDLAILPRWGADYCHGTLIAYWSGAARQIGYSGSCDDRFLTHVLTDHTLRHEVEHNLDVIRYLGGTVREDHLELWTGNEDDVFAEGVLSSRGSHTRDLVVALGVGALHDRRRWPIYRFVDVGQWLVKEYNARLLVLGGGDEEHLGKEFQQIGSEV